MDGRRRQHHDIPAAFSTVGCIASLNSRCRERVNTAIAADEGRCISRIPATTHKRIPTALGRPSDFVPKQTLPPETASASTTVSAASLSLLYDGGSHDFFPCFWASLAETASRSRCSASAFTLPSAPSIASMSLTATSTRQRSPEISSSAPNLSSSSRLTWPRVS